METGESMDVCPCAIETFGDAYPSIVNAVKLTELVSKCF